MSGVTFDQVTKRFGDVTAVDSVSLEIRDREFMVLLGPSGCGKSTALRMIAGLETVTEGELRIGDTVVNDVEAKERDIAMVFQSYALYPHMTVRENIEVPLKTRPYVVDGGAPRKLHKPERAERVAEAARILGLSELLDRKPGALSGGQRQRVALARAIVRRPQVFLLDEPLSNLDAKLRAQTRVELVELHRQLATTIVYVTHDQVEAMTMADRIAVLEDGRLQQVGAPREVYDRPANLFVARFIGSPPMNSLPGRVRGRGGGAWVEVGGGRLPAPDVDVADGTQVVVGLRPEHVRTGDGDGDGAEGLPATVRAVEWLGHERHLYCDVDGTPVIVRDAEEGEGSLRPGETVHLTAARHHVHLFDAGTTERLGP
ncbi:MAG TPA: sn-glycerol-3-phosphate ABC transporter ATP-binding protein UgpC [Acidimicrobiales bacterium]|nr:sn-glycerol-3-phosphate ABC transporter ATP-binding protein UgpC [Acidimicrobiales bacterium]